jgi:hypothetical protein
MKQTIKAFTNRVLGRHFTSTPAAYLHPDKKELIFACQRLSMSTFADLGAIWNVDGGYTFYAMERYTPRTQLWLTQM